MWSPRDPAAVTPSRVPCTRGVLAREEKNKRELKVFVELTCCGPAIHLWSWSGGLDPPSDGTMGAEPVCAGILRASKWQSPWFKEHRQNRASFTVMTQGSLLVFPLLKHYYFITAKIVLVLASDSGLWYYTPLKT